MSSEHSDKDPANPGPKYRFMWLAIELLIVLGGIYVILISSQIAALIIAKHGMSHVPRQLLSPALKYFEAVPNEVMYLHGIITASLIISLAGVGFVHYIFHRNIYGSRNIDAYILKHHRHSSPNAIALSITYLTTVLKEAKRSGIMLLACGLMCSQIWVHTGLDTMLYCGGVCFTVFFLICAKCWIVTYRIKTGLFATSRNEAIEFLEFITRNSGDIDFTDNDGNLRRALQSEVTIENLRAAGASTGTATEAEA